MSDARQALLKLLDGLGKSIQFATSGSLTPVLPGLEVKGVGSVGSPVSAADAQRLIAQATQAPYGRGEDTIVDPDVRRVWQIKPSQLVLRNAEWNRHLAEIVEAIKNDFGIVRKVNAQLYKLLIYEKGSFFAPHRDSEKASGMFATLVVCLPSRHAGGTLIVKHDGQTKKIAFGGKDAEFKTQYAAFYADCQHEIRPVTAGYRICLVYNLAIAGTKQPSAPQHTSAVEQAGDLLQELFADTAKPLNKIAIPFTHQYTQAGLDPRHLKGSDRARAEVLTRAAESLDYQCYVALLTHFQSGGVEDETWGYESYRSRPWYHRSYDEDEEDEEDEGGDDSDAEMGEIYDEELTLDHWLDPQGREQAFGPMHLEENEILSQDDREGWAIEQQVHEATGNEGVSLERWYRQGVLVIWPRERYFSILAGEGQASAVPALEKVAAHSKKPAALAACRGFAEEIIGHWQVRQTIRGGDASYSGRMLKLLERVGDVDLVQRFLRDVFPKDYDGSEGPALCRLGQHFGWESLGSALRGFLAQQQPKDYFARLGPIVSICESLCCEPPPLTEERRAVCTALAEELAQVIARWDKQPQVAWYAATEKRTGVVASVVHLLGALAAGEELEQFLTHVLSDKRHYDLHEVLIPDVKAMARWLPKVPAARPAFTRLREHCLAELRAATAQPNEPPTDWAREAKLGCNCEDCRALGRFLRDPGQRVGRFPLRKDRRQHLHQQIERHQCDCTHVTERSGSPQTLVCTKTQGSYERRLKQDKVDRKLLAELEALGDGERKPAVRRLSGRRQRKTGRSSAGASRQG